MISEEKIENGCNELLDQELKLKEKISYGLGNFAANLLITTANSFIVYFYTEIVGIAVATVGTLLLFARVFDGISDLIMGGIVDKTKSNEGKARPWMKWMMIPYILALVLLFTAPELSQTGKVVYAFITYVFAVGIIYTAISVPYNSMLATISRNQLERGQLSIFRSAFGFGGALLVGTVTLPLVEIFGGGKGGWLTLSVGYGAIGALLYYNVYKNTRERVYTDEQTAKDSVPFIKGIKALLKNKYWLIAMGVTLLGFINTGLAGGNVYYAQYILGDSNLIGMISIGNFLPIILMMPVMDPLIKKFGKRNLAIYGSVLSILGSLFMVFAPSNIVIVFIGLFIRGMGGAPMLVAGFAMLADTVEYGEWKTGIRTEGLSLSAGTFGEKVGSGLGGVILGAIMGMSGYIGGQAEQSASALASIEFIFIYLPIVFYILSIILLSFYKLDKEYPIIIKELQARKH